MAAELAQATITAGAARDLAVIPLDIGLRDASRSRAMQHFGHGGEGAAGLVRR